MKAKRCVVDQAELGQDLRRGHRHLLRDLVDVVIETD